MLVCSDGRVVLRPAYSNARGTGSDDGVAVVLQIHVTVVGRWTHGAATVVPGLVALAARATRAEQTRQSSLESLAEIPIEVSVDGRVQHRVEVADPEKYGDDDVRHGAHVFSAEGCNNIPQEEGHPASDEGPHDDPQGSSGLVLPFQFDEVPFSCRGTVLSVCGASVHQ